jgi:outer membrane protein assembly factor BamE
VILDLEAVLVGDLMLQAFDLFAGELDDAAGIDVDHVIVMFAAVDLVNRLATLEIMLEHQASGLELGQHAVNRGQTDIVVMLEQTPINILGSQMLAVESFKDFEDTHARVRDLESRLAQVLGFHAGLLNAHVHQRPASVSFGAFRSTVLRMTKALHILGFALCGLAVAACSPIYKLDIQQGNLFSKSTVDSLKPGMTKRQVTLVMGSPAVVSPFNQNRWDYVSTLRKGNGRMATKDLTLYFESDALTRIEGDYFAENPQELIKEATKYKRQYPDDKRPDDDKKKQQGGGGSTNQG